MHLVFPQVNKHLLEPDGGMSEKLSMMALESRGVNSDFRIMCMQGWPFDSDSDSE